MKTLNLNVVQRLTMINVLDQFKSVGKFTSTMEKLAHMLDDVKNLSFSEEEKTAAKISNDPEKPGVVHFDPTYTETKAVEFNDSTLDFVKAFLDDKDEKGEVTTADVSLLELKKLL